MPRKLPIKMRSVSVALPFGIGQVDLDIDETQQRAAWSLYVELMTRIAVQPLDPNSGLLREALSSLYVMFEKTRQILHEAGPQVAKAGDESIGSIAMYVLNGGIRPFTAKWHPLLLAYEKTRSEAVSAYAHEQAWKQGTQMRNELEKLQADLELYAEMLAKAAGVKHVGVKRANSQRL